MSTQLPTIVPFSSGLVEACAAIAATAPDPWNTKNLQEALDNPNRHCFVAVQNEVPMGIVCFLLVEASADLEIVAVAPTARRQGIGFSLLKSGLEEIKALGAIRCLLEVRASNKTAIALYQTLGFQTLSRRPAMYANPPEGGLLMAKALR